MNIPNTPSACYAVPGLKRFAQVGKRQLNIDALGIIHEVCEYLDVRPVQVQLKTRKVEVVYARHICMYLLCKYTRLSQSTIASFFKRDRTTVLHGRDEIKAQLRLGHKPHYRLDVAALEKIINSKNIGSDQ